MSPKIMPSQLEAREARSAVRSARLHLRDLQVRQDVFLRQPRVNPDVPPKEYDEAPGGSNMNGRRVTRDLLHWHQAAGVRTVHGNLRLRLISMPYRPDRPQTVPMPRGRTTVIGRRSAALADMRADAPGTIFVPMCEAGTTRNPDLISRSHATLCWYVTRDAELVPMLYDGHPGSGTFSANGTSVNGKLIEPCGCARLHVGDVIEFGTPFLMPERDSPKLNEFVYILERAARMYRGEHYDVVD